MALTITECDRRLIAVHAAYCEAIEHGDELSADAAYELLDDLLDQRLHIPLPRTAP